MAGSVPLYHSHQPSTHRLPLSFTAEMGYSRQNSGSTRLARRGAAPYRWCGPAPAITAYQPV